VSTQYVSVNTAKYLPGPQLNGLHSYGISQLQKDVLLSSEGRFVTQRLAPPDHGCKCAANTGVERKHEKLKDEG